MAEVGDGPGDGHDGEVALKRLRMRSWRRGMREMDLILGPFADKALADLPSRLRGHYTTLLSENDQDLYQWVTGSATSPPELLEIVEAIRAFHAISASGVLPNH